MLEVDEPKSNMYAYRRVSKEMLELLFAKIKKFKDGTQFRVCDLVDEICEVKIGKNSTERVVTYKGVVIGHNQYMSITRRLQDRARANGLIIFSTLMYIKSEQGLPYILPLVVKKFYYLIFKQVLFKIKSKKRGKELIHVNFKSGIIRYEINGKSTEREIEFFEYDDMWYDVQDVRFECFDRKHVGTGTEEDEEIYVCLMDTKGNVKKEIDFSKVGSADFPTIQECITKLRYDGTHNYEFFKKKKKSNFP